MAAIGIQNGWEGRLGSKRKGQPEHLTLDDLRGTAPTRLMRLKLSIAEAALHMGWKPSYAARMLDLYTAHDPDLAQPMILELDPGQIALPADATAQNGGPDAP